MRFTLFLHNSNSTQFVEYYLRHVKRVLMHLDVSLFDDDLDKEDVVFSRVFFWNSKCNEVWYCVFSLINKFKFFCVSKFTKIGFSWSVR